jgi:hypothetical protein
MPLGTVSSPLIGASLVQVWKPPTGVTPGVAGDATAPFALGTKVDVVPAATGGRNVAIFCRVGATGIAAAATAGITNGVTVAAAAGNTFTNDTGVALVTGDYAFLTTAGVSTP